MSRAKITFPQEFTFGSGRHFQISLIMKRPLKELGGTLVDGLYQIENKMFNQMPHIAGIHDTLRCAHYDADWP